MSFELNSRIIKWLDDHFEETVALTEELCRIPAPSHHEEKRAEYCKNWLEKQGAKGVYIDEALNVVWEYSCEDRDDITVFMAHTDTVFPDMTEPMPCINDGKYIHSPGVGDDTLHVAIMFMVIKYILEHNLSAKSGILFVANSCEEGLGNLKGVRQIMENYKGRVKELYTFDAVYTSLINCCVGSHRYNVTFKTEGGHSFNNFGNRNAIAAMSDFVCRMYSQKVPQKDGAITTYNAGVAQGGTSVNTVAQNASVLYEYRSNDSQCLESMKQSFETVIADMKKENVADIEVKVVGIRPCADNVDAEKVAAMTAKAIAICEKYTGLPCKEKMGSTDCNIPMSQGVPAVCVGLYMGGGAHTREEYAEIESMRAGQKIAAELILEYFE